MAKDTKNQSKHNHNKETFNPFKAMPNMPGDMPSMDAHMEMIRSLQKINYDTFQNLMKLQNEYLKRLAEEWADLAKLTMSSEPFAKKTEAQSKTIKDTIEKSVEQLQKIRAVIQKNQTQAMSKLKNAGAKKATAKKPAAKKKTTKPSKKK